MEDREIAAIVAMNDALKGLDSEERLRVMRFMYEKYAPKVSVPSQETSADEQKILEEGNSRMNESASYSTFAETLAASGAKNSPERFLVAAYWLLKSLGKDEFKTFEVTKILKGVGYQIGNASSNAVRPLKSSAPAQIVQVSKKQAKSGKGHATFKLTIHGVNKVEGMLNAATI